MAENFNPILPTMDGGGGIRFNQPPVNNTLGQALNATARLIDTGVDLFNAAAKAQAKQEENRGISEYASEVGKLQAGYEQGLITRTQLDAQRRATFRTYSTKYPQNINEFSAVEKQMFGYSSNAKEEAIVQAGLAQQQKALQAGWEVLGTDATEEQALLAGNRRLQHEANIDATIKQLQVVSSTANLQGVQDKRLKDKADQEFTMAVNGSLSDQTNYLMQDILGKNPKEIEQNAAELSQNVARVRSLVSMQLGKVLGELGRQGISPSPESVKAIRDNLDNQMNNIEAYIQNPSEQRKKAIQDMDVIFKGNLQAMSPEFAKLNALGPVTGGAILGYLAQQNRDGDVLQGLSTKASDAWALTYGALEGRVNLAGLSPDERRKAIGSLNTALQTNITGVAKEPEKEASTFMKAFKAFTQELPTADRGTQLAIVDSITTPTFLANLDAAIKAGVNIDMSGVTKSVQQARALLQQEISTMLNSQNPNAYGQNALGVNMTADAEGNISLNMEPVDAVAARSTPEGPYLPGPLPNFAGPEGRTTADPMASTADIQPTPMVAQIQKTVDTFNRLNTVLKMLAPQGPSGTAGPPGPMGNARADAVVMDAVRQVESGGNNKAVSPKGALGPYQVMPATAKNPGYGIKPLEDPTDPKEARRFATEYLTAMKQEFGDNPYLAVLAYNAGPGPVKQWLAGKGDLPDETIQYARKIMREIGGL